MEVRVLSNARWRTPNGRIAALISLPDPGYVGIALFEGNAYLDTMPLHATLDEALEFCDASYERLPSVLARITTATDLGALCWMAEYEARQILSGTRMPRRSMS